MAYQRCHRNTTGGVLPFQTHCTGQESTQVVVAWLDHLTEARSGSISRVVPCRSYSTGHAGRDFTADCNTISSNGMGTRSIMCLQNPESADAALHQDHHYESALQLAQRVMYCAQMRANACVYLVLTSSAHCQRYFCTCCSWTRWPTVVFTTTIMTDRSLAGPCCE